MNPEIKSELNSLLFLLRNLEVVKCVRTYYARYGNDNPPHLLQAQIDKMQQIHDGLQIFKVTQQTVPVRTGLKFALEPGQLAKYELVFELYKNNRLAICLFDSKGAAGVLTANPNAPLEPGEFFIKNWSENEGLARAALDSGIFEDTGKRVASDYVQVPVWRFKNVEIRYV